MSAWPRVTVVDKDHLHVEGKEHLGAKALL